MVNLRENEAIEYLQRARSVFHPMLDPYSNLPLVASMLEIEAAYIENLASNPELKPLAGITVDNTGFPELNSWIVDIQRVLRVYRKETATRAKSLLPLLESY